MSLAARYVWTYLPCHADREGRLKDSAFSLKAAILPVESIETMISALAELAERRHIIRYEVDGRKFIQIRTFLKHQSPHTRETESIIPPPPGNYTAEHVLDSASTSPGSAGVSPSPSIPDLVPGLSLSAPLGSLRPDQTRSNEEANGSDEPRLRGGALTGNDLQRVFGQVRCKKVGGLPWQSVRVEGGAASTMADTLNEHPEARADVIPTMELLFDRAKTGKAGGRSADILREPSFAFGAWLSQWTSLREELHGLTPKVPAAALPRPAGEKPWLEADKARESTAAFARMEGRRVLAELAAAEKAAEQTAAGGSR